MSNEHDPYVSHEFDHVARMNWWVARCEECGYRSRLLGSPFLAERAAAQHAKAKNGETK